MMRALSPSGGGIDPEQRRAGPHQIAIDGAAEHYPRGIGERGRDAAIHDADLAKNPDLLVVHRVVGNFTAGELTHQQRNAVVLGLDARRNSDRLVDGDAQPIDSGIDMQRRAAAPGFHVDEGIPLGELGGAVDDRPQRGVGKRLRRARHQPVEHVDGACRRDRPYAAALGDVGDEEGPAPGLRQLGGNLLEAAAIARAHQPEMVAQRLEQGGRVGYLHGSRAAVQRPRTRAASSKAVQPFARTPEVEVGP